MKNLSILALVTCMPLGFGSASATSYSVELTGNDSNSGLVGSPWRTLAKACETVTADEGHVIQIGEGTFTEAEILTLKSGFSLIGAGSGKTKILVDHHFSLTDAVPNANPHVNTFPEHFILQMNGSNQVVKGFALDGQDKRCHGGIIAPWTRDVVFEDLHVTNFRYSGLWVLDANETILRFSRFKNNTYRNPKGAGEGGGDSGAVQYHCGKNLTIHDNHIEETGNLRPDFGGYAMKAQDRNFSVSEFNVPEGLKVYNNTLIVPTNGAWENGMAPSATFTVPPPGICSTTHWLRSAVGSVFTMSASARSWHETHSAKTVDRMTVFECMAEWGGDGSERHDGYYSQSVKWYSSAGLPLVSS